MLGWICIILSFISSIVFLILIGFHLQEGFLSGYLSDDLLFIIPAGVISFLALFLSGRVYIRVSNSKLNDSNLIAASSIFSIIGIVLSFVVLILQLIFKKGEPIGIILILPVVFSFFYLISTILLFISWLRKKE